MKKTMDSITAESRFRNFATIVYPESAPSNWMQLLRDLHIEGFVSPLHDSDFSADQTPKKPHYHVLLTFPGKKSVEQIRQLLEPINSVGVEIVQSLRAYARYLCHLDDYEKAQYLTDDVVSLSGLDYYDVIGSMDRYSAICDMEEFCDRQNIFSYAELSSYARQNNHAWHRILCSCATIHMTAYLKSRSWGNK